RDDRFATATGAGGRCARTSFPGRNRQRNLRLVSVKYLVHHQKRKRDRNALSSRHVYGSFLYTERTRLAVTAFCRECVRPFARTKPNDSGETHGAAF